MLKHELEYRVLKLLEERPDLTQRQLSQALGVSLGKAHYIVKALIDVGWIKLGNFRRSNRKLGYAYLLTPSGIAEKSVITAKFLVRKQHEYEALREEIAELKKELQQQSAVSEPPS